MKQKIVAIHEGHDVERIKNILVSRGWQIIHEMLELRTLVITPVEPTLDGIEGIVVSDARSVNAYQAYI